MSNKNTILKRIFEKDRIEHVVLRFLSFKSDFIEFFGGRESLTIIWLVKLPLLLWLLFPLYLLLHWILAGIDNFFTNDLMLFDLLLDVNVEESRNGREDHCRFIEPFGHKKKINTFWVVLRGVSRVKYKRALRANALNS